MECLKAALLTAAAVALAVGSGGWGCRGAAPIGAAPVLAVLSATETRDGADARLYQVLPGALPHVDPLAYFVEFDFAPPAGFPDHPHRGFEGLTYMMAGSLRHRDDLGNDGLVAAGGAQRFTAGRGIVHSEMPGGPGPSRGFQLWMNLPRRLKETAPSWQQLEASAVPVTTGQGVEVRTVVSPGGPITLQTAALLQDIGFEAGGRFEQTFAPGWQGLIYVVAGEVTVGGAAIGPRHAAVVGAGRLRLVAAGPSRAIVAGGAGHGEPIRHTGGSLE